MERQRVRLDVHSPRPGGTRAAAVGGLQRHRERGAERGGGRSRRRRLHGDPLLLLRRQGHAYWLDKTQHGSWPYTVPTSGAPGDDFRFASEPVVVDLDNDGHAEVIFTSWPKKATGGVGQLHVLDYLGRELYRVDLPTPAIGAGWNGSLGAPTIANIDSDPDLELVMGTNASGVVAYKLPNTANARVLWGTGRGNYGRTGVPGTVTALAPPDTTPPTVSITAPANGATVSATVTVTAN